MFSFSKLKLTTAKEVEFINFINKKYINFIFKFISINFINQFKFIAFIAYNRIVVKMFYQRSWCF